MRRFAITDLPLEGLKLVTRRRLGDQRGFLERMFCAEEFARAGWTGPIVQINHTFTAQRGTVRGIHYQRPPHAEMKCVSCLRGSIWDVAVDVRESSPTYLKWHAERLSAADGTAMLIPEGYAHGYQSLTDDTVLIYFHSTVFTPDAEAGLNPCDPALGIAWPLEITGLSERDANHPMLPDLSGGFTP